MECMACGQQTHSPLVRGGALLCATCREAGDTADLRDRIAELEAENERLRKRHAAIEAALDAIRPWYFYDGCGCCSSGPLSETDVWKDLVSAAKEGE